MLADQIGSPQLALFFRRAFPFFDYTRGLLAELQAGRALFGGISSSFSLLRLFFFFSFLYFLLGYTDLFVFATKISFLVAPTSCRSLSALLCALLADRQLL